MSAAGDDARAVPIAPTRWLPPRFFLFLVLGAAAHFALGGPVLLRSRGVGVALFASGIALALWGACEFAAVGATVSPTERSTRLVESGPFRWSLLALRLRFIANEERALEASRVAAYLAYETRVRRWL